MNKLLFSLVLIILSDNELTFNTCFLNETLSECNVITPLST